MMTLVLSLPIRQALRRVAGARVSKRSGHVVPPRRAIVPESRAQARVQRPPRHSKFTLLDGSLPHGRAIAAHADTL